MDVTNTHWLKIAKLKGVPFPPVLPAFAESPVRKGGDECEKGIRHSLGEGGSASAGSAEDVKMPRAEARGASRIVCITAFFLTSNS